MAEEIGNIAALARDRGSKGLREIPEEFGKRAKAHFNRRPVEAQPAEFSGGALGVKPDRRFGDLAVVDPERRVKKKAGQHGILLFAGALVDQLVLDDLEEFALPLVVGVPEPRGSEVPGQLVPVGVLRDAVLRQFEPPNRLVVGVVALLSQSPESSQDAVPPARMAAELRNQKDDGFEGVGPVVGAGRLEEGVNQTVGETFLGLHLGDGGRVRAAEKIGDELIVSDFLERLAAAEDLGQERAEIGHRSEEAAQLFLVQFERPFPAVLAPAPIAAVQRPPGCRTDVVRIGSEDDVHQEAVEGFVDHLPDLRFGKAEKLFLRGIVGPGKSGWNEGPWHEARFGDMRQAVLIHRELALLDQEIAKLQGGLRLEIRRLQEVLNDRAFLAGPPGDPEHPAGIQLAAENPRSALAQRAVVGRLDDLQENVRGLWSGSLPTNERFDQLRLHFFGAFAERFDDRLDDAQRYQFASRRRLFQVVALQGRLKALDIPQDQRRAEGCFGIRRSQGLLDQIVVAAVHESETDGRLELAGRA